MSITEVVKQLRSRGILIDCVGWYPWRHAVTELHGQPLGFDSCGMGSMLSLGGQFWGLGGHFGTLGGHLGTFGDHLGTLGGHLGTLRGHFGTLGGHFGTWGGKKSIYPI